MWGMTLDGPLEILESIADDRSRLAALMEKYHDLPMSLADASLMVSAERLGCRRVLTLDADSLVYRMHGRVPFDLVLSCGLEGPALREPALHHLRAYSWAGTSSSGGRLRALTAPWKAATGPDATSVSFSYWARARSRHKPCAASVCAVGAPSPDSAT